MLILGIETSCDETAASLVQEKDGNLSVLSSIVSSQAKLHAKWGGVVPNLASREHLKNIIPVLQKTFQEAKKKPPEIDLIAVTNGPGLIPALLIGTSTAKTLAYVWKKPLLGIHHIEGHIYANFVNEISSISKSKFPMSKQISNPKSQISFPILCLIVSGGHTQLILMKKHLDYEIVGQTLDDAAGEAFDKVARILGLGYPGGPAIAAKAAMIATSDKRQVTSKNKSMSHVSCHMSQIKLPRPMINSNNFNFSFSGLKTAALYETKKHPEFLKDKEYISEMCHEFQQSVVDVLISKTLKAAKKYHPKTIMLAGGVSANEELREQFGKAVSSLPATSYQLPATSYSIDNAAMIAAAAYFRWKNMSNSQKKEASNNWKVLETDSNLKLK